MRNHTRSNLTNIHAPIPCSFTLAAVLVLVCICGTIAAVEMGDFKAPSLDGYKMTGEEDGDGDGDGLKETHIVHYKNETGDRLFSMTTRGKLWAWSRQSHAGTESDKNYVIRDSNCDGVFEQRYDLDEEFHIPDCLQFTRKPRPADHP